MKAIEAKVVVLGSQGTFPDTQFHHYKSLCK